MFCAKSRTGIFARSSAAGEKDWGGNGPFVGYHSTFSHPAHRRGPAYDILTRSQWEPWVICLHKCPLLKLLDEKLSNKDPFHCSHCDAFTLRSSSLIPLVLSAHQPPRPETQSTNWKSVGPIEATISYSMCKCNRDSSCHFLLESTPSISNIYKDLQQ
jgi:hypothetical protein